MPRSCACHGPKIERIARVVGEPHPCEEVQRQVVALDEVEEPLPVGTLVQPECRARSAELQLRADTFYGSSHGGVHLVELVWRSVEVQGAEVRLVPELPPRYRVGEPAASPAVLVVSDDVLHDSLVRGQIAGGTLVGRNRARDREQDVCADGLDLPDPGISGVEVVAVGIVGIRGPLWKEAVRVVDGVEPGHPVVCPNEPHLRGFPDT